MPNPYSHNLFASPPTLTLEPPCHTNLLHNSDNRSSVRSIQIVPRGRVMEPSKPFLVKNILEIDEDSPEVRNKVAKFEEYSEKEADASETTKGQEEDTQEGLQERQLEETQRGPQEGTHEGPQDIACSQIDRRKIRRCFRAEQLEYLERCFMEAIYPEASMRKRIAQELKVSNDRVQVWFQNRRAKARKHWKQQYCGSTLPRMHPQNTPKQLLPTDPHSRFSSPFSPHSQLHREFHMNRIDRRNSMISMLPSERHRVQPLPSMPLCSCYPIPRSMGHFKPYDPRLSQSPTPPVPPRHCHCLPIRPRPNCMP